MRNPNCISFFLALIFVTGCLSGKSLASENAVYSPADLAGTWQVNSLASGPGAPWWEYGPLVMAADGSYQGALVEYPNQADPVEGQFQIAPDGIVTWAGKPLDPRENGFGRGHMTLDKNLIVMIATWSSASPGTTQMILFTRQGADYQSPDLTGTWQVNSLASGPGAPWWEYGPLTMAADGSFQATLEEYRSEPDQIEGRIQIGASGIVTAAGAPLDPQLSGLGRGHMSADKNLIVMLATWTSDLPGTTEMRVLTRQGNTYQSTDLAGSWQVHALASGLGAPWWEYGPLTMSEDGTFQGSLITNRGESDEVEGRFQIDANGIVTGSGIPLDPQLNDMGRGHMARNKNVIVMLATWATGSPGTAELRILTRSAASTSLISDWMLNE
ncbi:MAG: hypothetical protein ACE15F_01990 [bacterium]